ncbi:MAG: DUF6152 family protein [Bryobacteraceae bacterium]|jgi:hypothetical protein
MKKLLLPLFAVLGILVAAAPTFAHHAFAAEYDANKPITLKGKLTKVDWVNPHGWIHLDVTDDSGKVTSWAVECGAPNAMLRRGLRKTDFPEGLEVTVSGFRAKNGSPTMNGTNVKLPDGRNLFTGGSSPDEKAPKE